MFFGIHSTAILSQNLRKTIIGKIGENKWLGIYSLFAVFGLLLLTFGYSEARQNPVFIYGSPYFLKHVVWLLMVPVFPLLLLAYLPGKLKNTISHPMLTAFAIWSGSHLLVNGTLADLILFGGFFVWSIAIQYSLFKYPRNRSAKAQITRHIKYDFIAIVLGLLIYAGFFFWLHQKLIGIPVR